MGTGPSTARASGCESRVPRRGRGWWLSLPEERFREGPTLPAGRPDQRALRQPKTRAFAELLIDCAEDRTLRAVIVGMLREG